MLCKHNNFAISFRFINLSNTNFLFVTPLPCIVSLDEFFMKITFLTTLDTTPLSLHDRCRYGQIKGDTADISIFRFRWFEPI